MKHSDDAAIPAAKLFRLCIPIFFIGGFLSSTISLFVPRMTLMYGLDYPRALLVQLAFHSSYLLFALPIAAIIIRLGYMRATATGLAIMALSCTLLLFGHTLHSYSILLLSLLALSAGITFLQIAANTIAAVVGGSDKAAVRLNLLQAFNSLGTVLAPLLAADFVLAGTVGSGLASASQLAPPFLFAITLLVVMALAFLRRRDLLTGRPDADLAGARLDWGAMLRNRRLVAGTGAIFVYVGAEVAIGTLLVNYLLLTHAFGTSPVAAARLVSLYWGGAMIGRAAGALILRRVAPSRLLMLAAVMAAGLVTIAASHHGAVGGIALLSVGLCNSIMYPTIYVLALPGDAKLATPGATLLCMAVVGGAVVPMLTGLLAQQVGLAGALVVPAICYLFIAVFARACWGSRV